MGCCCRDGIAFVNAQVCDRKRAVKNYKQDCPLDAAWIKLFWCQEIVSHHCKRILAAAKQSTPAAPLFVLGYDEHNKG